MQTFYARHLGHGHMSLLYHISHSLCICNEINYTFFVHDSVCVHMEEDEYQLLCVISLKETQLATQLYHIPFYSEKFRLLFSEWKDMSNHAESSMEWLSLPATAPGLHEKDPLSMYRAKIQFFRLINSESQIRIQKEAGKALKLIEKLREGYARWFFDHKHTNSLALYVEELVSQNEEDSVALRNIKSNAAKAVMDLREATLWRSKEWLEYTDSFLVYWGSLYV